MVPVAAEKACAVVWLSSTSTNPYPHESRRTQSGRLGTEERAGGRVPARPDTPGGAGRTTEEGAAAGSGHHGGRGWDLGIMVAGGVGRLSSEGERRLDMDIAADMIEG